MALNDILDELNETWLNGKYKNGEINTSLEYIAVNEPDFFAQGEEAGKIIKEIYQYWLYNDCTNEDAFNNWVNLYL